MMGSVKSERKFCLRKAMTAEQKREMDDQISASNKELEPLLNFVRGDPNVLKKPNREDFFKEFHQFQTVYAEVDKWDRHELKVYMLVPKGLNPEKAVAFHCLLHGGGLTTGGGNYVHWFNDYKRKLAIDANAITLIPMYRLMPEDRGEEIQDDICAWWEYYSSLDFHDWIQDCIRDSIKKEFSLRRDLLLISGESAGGMLAVYTWLTHSGSVLPIRALYLQYPMLNYYSRNMDGKEVSYMDIHVTRQDIEHGAEALISCTNKQRAENRCVSRSDSEPPEGMAAAMCLSNTHRWEEVFKDGKADILDIRGNLERLRKSYHKLEHFPDMFIIHGQQDKAIPIADTREFKTSVTDLAETAGKTVNINFREFPGKDHAFDYEIKPGDDEQVDAMMRSIIEAWCTF